MASAYMDVVESWACPNNCCSVFSGTPQLIALMPKPCRSPLGVACGPAIFAAFMTAQTTYQPFVRLQFHSRTDLAPSRRFCAARMS